MVNFKNINNIVFDSLKKKFQYYRSLTDYKLTPNRYVMIMLDGSSFSKAVAQYYFSSKELHKKVTDTQVEMVKKTRGVDWPNDFNDGEKIWTFY